MFSRVENWYENCFIFADLLRKLLSFEGAVGTLLQTDVKEVTILSVLRRIMSMKVPNLHFTCVQIVLLILQSKHDGAEQILNTDLIGKYQYNGPKTKYKMLLSNKVTLSFMGYY